MENAEEKLKALLTGLECQNIDLLMANVKTEDFEYLGKVMATRTKKAILGNNVLECMKLEPVVKTAEKVVETWRSTSHGHADLVSALSELYQELEKYKANRST